MKKINVKQVWEYEFKPTDTMYILKAMANACAEAGDTLELKRRGGKIYAVRTNENH